MPKKRAVPARERNRVEKTIYFYRLDVGTDDAGEPVVFPVHESLQFLSGRRHNQRLVAGHRDTPGLFCWIDNATATGRLRLANIRTNGFPQIERLGDLTDLDVPEGAGLAEVVEFVFFPEQIVGAIFNFYGPRASRLGYYFSRTLPREVAPSVSLTPLLRQDVAERLRRMQDIRLLDLKVRESFLNEVQVANQSLASAFRAAFRAGEAQEVEIVLRARPRTGDGLGARLLETARNLVRQDNLRENVSRFKVRGVNAATGNLEVLDLLSDELLLKAHIPLAHPKGRALATEPAYNAIRTAYNELRDELRVAAGLDR